MGVLEPEHFTLFQDEPAAPPRLDVVALLGQPPDSLRVGPELDSLVVTRVRVLTRHCPPQALHLLLLHPPSVYLSDRVPRFNFYHAGLAIHWMNRRRFTPNVQTCLLTTTGIPYNN